MEDNRIQNQIAIYMTNKKLCEFTDKLKPAPIEYYAHMHAQGEEQADRGLPEGEGDVGIVGVERLDAFETLDDAYGDGEDEDFIEGLQKCLSDDKLDNVA